MKNACNFGMRCAGREGNCLMIMSSKEGFLYIRLKAKPLEINRFSWSFMSTCWWSVSDGPTLPLLWKSHMFSVLIRLLGYNVSFDIFFNMAHLQWVANLHPWRLTCNLKITPIICTKALIFGSKRLILFDSTHPIHIYDTLPGLEIPFPSKFPMFSMASYISPPSVGQRGNGCAFRRELAKKLISMAERLGIRALLEQDSGHVCVKIPATGLRCVNGKTSGDKKLQPRDGEHVWVKGFQ